MSSDKEDLRFEADILPLFRSKDIRAMRRRGLDLSDYEDVKENAEEIYDALSSGSMPCDAPWPKEDVQKFRDWIDTGMHPISPPSGSGANVTKFSDAEVRLSRKGKLDTVLTVAKTPNKLGSADVNLRNYDGALVGPTLRVKPGDTINIRLVNSIKPLHLVAGHHDEDPKDIINLHTHGLHVSPAGNSDNVLVRVHPGQEFEYEIKVPTDHPAGTFWYHSHVHGSTAIQVASGLAGALIVEGDIDQVPEIEAADERIFMFQQPVFDDNGEIESHAGMGFGEWWGLDRYTAINGVVRPTIYMRPGEIQRWRMIHGGFRDVIDLEFEGMTFKEIAIDGLTTGRLDDTKETVELYPGYRRDILIQANSVGTFHVIDRAMLANNSSSLTDRHIVAVVVVAGDPEDMYLPKPEQLKDLAPFSHIEDNEITGFQSVEFKIDVRPARAGLGPPLFQVDNQSFSPSESPRALKLGATEEWRLTTNLGEHPFHIHVNPFEVVRVVNISSELDEDGQTCVSKGKEDADFVPFWCDTFVVKQNQEVFFRTRYTRYIGKFVLHCHILDHEDQGMMQLVEITP